MTENGFGKTADDLSRAFAVGGMARPEPGGGSQEPVSRERSLEQNTNPLTELEMANNRPTPDSVQHAGALAERASCITATC